MDHLDSDDALDALGDLFLTGPQHGAPTATATRPARSADPLTGPRPFRLMPKAVVAVDATRYQTPAVESPVAEPPRLRLSNDDGPDVADAPVAVVGEEPTQVPVAAGVHSEWVHLGNLPGIASPWLTQYAHWLAQSRGPVAVLHIDDQQIDVDLVGTIAQRSQLDAVKQAWTTRSDDDLVSRMGRLAAGDPVTVACWLLDLDGEVVDSVSQLGGRIRQWTLLSGADAPAAVAAYRWLKQALAEEASRPESVAVMVMGSDDDRAAAMVEKLQVTAERFLNTPVTMLGARKQMVPVGVESLGSFMRQPDTLDALLALATGAEAPPRQAIAPAALHEAPPLAATEPEPVPAPPPRPRTAVSSSLEQFVQRLKTSQPEPDESLPHLDGEHPRPAPQPEPEAEPVAEGPAAEQPAPSSPPADPVRMAPVLPRITQAPAAPRGAGSAELDLSAFLDGALRLAARCPDHPAAQLVLDDDGALHLLLRHQHPTSLSDALVELLSAKRWVARHIDLLQMTQRQVRLDRSAEPRLHLFTDDPRPAVALASQGPIAISLHLLREIRVGGESTWFCTQLM